MLDITSLQSDTANPQQLVHFNNAGCALSPNLVTDAVIEYLRKEQFMGGYEAAIDSEQSILSFYSEFAALLNCESSEIAYIENASRAWQLALHSLSWNAGDEIITCENEYVSNYLDLLNLQKQYGVKLVLVPCDDHGLVDLDALEKAINKNSRLIALTHIASQRGDIQPAREVGKIAKKYELLYLLDACQSVGQVVLDTKLIGCDFLCGTGRKYLRGPRGTGFLFASKTSNPYTNPLFIDNHSASWTGENSFVLSPTATRFETWERNIAGKIGLAKAVAYANKLGMNDIENRVNDLAKQLSTGLAEIAGVNVLEKSSALSGIVTFQKTSASASEIVANLRLQKMNTSVSKRENARLDLGKQEIGDVVRASIHYYNTLDEIERFTRAVKQI